MQISGILSRFLRMHFFASVTRQNAKGEAVLDAINGIPVTLPPQTLGWLSWLGGNGDEINCVKIFSAATFLQSVTKISCSA